MMKRRDFLKTLPIPLVAPAALLGLDHFPRTKKQPRQPQTVPVRSYTICGKHECVWLDKPHILLAQFTPPNDILYCKDKQSYFGLHRYFVHHLTKSVKMIYRDSLLTSLLTTVTMHPQTFEHLKELDFIELPDTEQESCPQDNGWELLGFSSLKGRECARIYANPYLSQWNYLCFSNNAVPAGSLAWSRNPLKQKPATAAGIHSNAYEQEYLLTSHWQDEVTEL